MDAGSVTSIALFAVATSITPGPNNAMLVASGINFGFYRSIPHMLGISIGFPVMLLAIGFGFGTILESHPLLFRILEVVGSLYLLYMAWQIAQAGELTEVDAPGAKPFTIWQAAAFQWVNPKAWIIATSALSVYLVPTNLVPSLLLIAILFGLVNFPCIAVWAASGVALRRVLKSPRQRKIFNRSMAVLLVLSLLTSLLHAAPPFPTTKDKTATWQKINRVIQSYTRERDFSGSILIQQKGSTQFERNVGFADRARKAKITKKTRFQIASISKLYVASAILKLADRGQLGLQDPVDRFVPGLPPALALVTLEELLRHQSGLSRDAEFSSHETLSLDTHIARIARQPLESARRGQYSYSNSGYVLLAKVAEVVTGKPFARVLQDDVLAPNLLRDTGFIVGDARIERLATGYARGLTGWRIPARARHKGVYAPGGLYATTRDLARFFSRLRSGKVLGKVMTDHLFAPTLDVEHGRQRAAIAGLYSTSEGRDYLLVAGSGDGAKCALMHARMSGTTVIILSNNGDFPVSEMMRDLVLCLEGKKPPPLAPTSVSNPSRFKAFVGRYDFAGTGLPGSIGQSSYPISFVLDGPKAYLWDHTEGAMALLCEGDSGMLRAVESKTIRLKFQQDEDQSRWMVITIEGQTYRARMKNP